MRRDATLPRIQITWSQNAPTSRGATFRTTHHPSQASSMSSRAKAGLTSEGSPRFSSESDTSMAPSPSGKDPCSSMQSSSRQSRPRNGLRHRGSMPRHACKWPTYPSAEPRPERRRSNASTHSASFAQTKLILPGTIASR